MRIAFVINDRFCPAGLIEDVVADAGHDIIELFPHEGDVVPKSIPQDWDGLIAFGGRMSAYDDDTHPASADIAHLIARAHDAGLPFLGVCLGVQQLARALGEERFTMESAELGFAPLALTDEGRADPLLQGIPVAPVMQVHEDSFRIPPGGELLMSGEGGIVQAMKVGPTTYGFQCHFETKADSLSMWLNMLEKEYSPQFTAKQAEMVSAAAANSKSYLSAAQAFGTELTRRWLDMAKNATLTSQARHEAVS